MSEAYTVATTSELSKLAEKLAAADSIGLDYETASFSSNEKAALEHDKIEVVGAGFAFPDGESCYVPMMHASGINANRQRVMTILENVLTDHTKEIWAHNAKFEYMVSRTLRIKPKYKIRDSMVLQYLLGKKLQGAGGLKLKAAVKEYLKYNMTTWEEVMNSRSKAFHVPIDTMTKYCADDALQCLRLADLWLPELEELQLTKVFTDLEMPFIPVLVHMKESGFNIDMEYLDDLDTEFRTELEEVRRQFEALVGVSISSSQAVSRRLYEDLQWWPAEQLKFERGKSGFYSVDAGHLERVGNAISKDTDAYRAYELKSRFQRLDKLCSTYTLPLIEHCKLYEDERLRGDFNQCGTRTGRLACVSGDTLLKTTRGDFKISEYEVIKGDEILTHRGRYRPIVRKILKGLDTMFRVVLESGCRIDCTKEHRFLTPDGWCSLGELSSGEEVFNVCVEEGPERPCFSEDGVGTVFSRSREANDTTDTFPVKNNLPYSCCHSPAECRSRTDGIGETTEVLQEQDGRSESHEGEARREPSQLEGRLLGLQGISDSSSRRCPLLCSSDSYVAGTEDFPGESSKLLSSSSHRRESIEQRVRQPCIVLSGWSPEITPKANRIASIFSLGTMEVYDIEVEEDHSYVAQGFINHNSSDPNLQNIPQKSEEGHKIRNAFIASKGWKMGVADYSQADLVMMAHLSQDPMLLKAYNEGLDLHSLTAENCKCDRPTGKVINLGLIYEMGTKTLQGQLKDTKNKEGKIVGVSEKEAQRLWDAWHRTYPLVRKYHERMHKYAEQHGYVRTITGRIRYIEDIRNKNSYKRMLAQHEASNTPDQGSVSDVIKIAMRNLYQEWLSRDVLYDYYTGKGKAKLLSQVHDELIFEATEDFIEEAASDVQRHMEHAVALRAPMTAVPGIGDNWNSAKSDGKVREKAYVRSTAK
jgi:DNA polymerase I-like protein with 3'-5' exonuclease and polymerase domains